MMMMMISISFYLRTASLALQDQYTWWHERIFSCVRQAQS